MPLTGLGSQLPFFKRLIDWLGIGVQAEAREDYKSIVAQYTREKLSEPQTANQEELLHSLNDLMLERIARNRFVDPPKLEFNPFPFGSAPALEPVEQDAEMEENLTSKTVASSPLEEQTSKDQSYEPSAIQDEPSVVKDADSNSTTSIARAPETTVDSEENANLKALDPLIPVEPTPVAKSILDKVRISTQQSMRLTCIDLHTQQLRKLTFQGPFSAKEATENGLVGQLCIATMNNGS